MEQTGFLSLIAIHFDDVRSYFVITQYPRD